MNDYRENYPYSLVEDLLWCRNYHKMLIKEIDQKLIDISKKYGLEIPLDDSTLPHRKETNTE